MDINQLPSDPAMLLSFVNTRLRDEFPSLQELCLALDIDIDVLSERLAQAGFEYDAALNKFW